jgi:hypothetical protein
MRSGVAINTTIPGGADAGFTAVGRGGRPGERRGGAARVGVGRAAGRVAASAQFWLILRPRWAIMAHRNMLRTRGRFGAVFGAMAAYHVCSYGVVQAPTNLIT